MPARALGLCCIDPIQSHAQPTILLMLRSCDLWAMENLLEGEESAENLQLRTLSLSQLGSHGSLCLWRQSVTCVHTTEMQIVLPRRSSISSSVWDAFLSFSSLASPFELRAAQIKASIILQ